MTAALVARRDRRAALAAVVVLLGLTGIAAAAAAGLLVANRDVPVPASTIDLDQMLGQRWFLVSKIIAALLFAAAGWLVASRRPELALGYVLLIGGLADAAGVLGGEWAIHVGLVDRAARLGGTGLWLGSWLFSIEPVVIVTLYYLFPDGRSPGRPGVWFAGMPVLLCTVGIIGSVLAPLQTDPVGPFAALRNPLGAVSVTGLGATLGIGLLLGSAVLVLRWLRQRGEDRRRFRLLALVALSGFVLPLLPISTQAARVLYELHSVLLVLVVLASVLRHRLYGVEVVLNRTLVYLALSMLVVGVYGLLVGILVMVFGRVDLSMTPVVAVAAALCLLPARGRVQQAVNRLLYGQRDEPFAVITRIAGRLETVEDPSRQLQGLLQALTEELRLPGAALSLRSSDGVDARFSAGVSPDSVDSVFPLVHQGDVLGELLVARRSGQHTLDPDEVALLEQVARQSAVAARGVLLLEELIRSRERVVGVAEEERRRLSRDLHDGLGPLLTAAAHRIDACLSLIERDPTRVVSLMTEVRADLTDGLDELRRLVYSLRPPALDELGLIEAIEQLCRRNSVPTELAAPAALPALPAAVEVTAYRIVAEALTNVARHSGASHCTVRAHADHRLTLDIIDNGPSGLAWRPGVGVNSMVDRAAELGGTCLAGPEPAGGRVHAELPLTLFGIQS